MLGASLAERVHFLGHIDREKVLACMMRATIFAFPSNLEACPLVALEAMELRHTHRLRECSSISRTSRAWSDWTFGGSNFSSRLH